MMLIHAATFLLLIVDIHAATSTVTTARETCRTRIAECTMNGGNVPVCGSDGVTYPSQCKVISQQCQGVSVLIKHTGPCAALKGIHVSLQTTPTIQPFNDFLDANSKEESDTNDCLSDRRSALEPLQDQNKTSRSQLYIPECTPDGRYHRIQCYSGYCWCVLQDSGKPIPGTSIKQPISPNCNPVPTPSRPIKGCSESRKQQFLQDLVNLMQTRMTASIDTNETAKWNASPQEKVSTWLFVILDKNKNKLLEKKEWKGFRTLVSNDKQLRKCGKKLPKHCDVNNDRVISMTEWLNCLHVSYSLTDRDIEKASNLNKAVNQTKRIGPNPLDRYLNGD